MTIEILDLAREDLADGYRFYERSESGVGRYFLTNLFADIESLKITAGIHRKPHGAFHRSLSKRFPYAIYYTLEDDRIRIHAIVDCRRDPSWIKDHLRES